MRTHPHRESGSIIVWIFIGIAVFAALGVTVSNMMRSGNPDSFTQEKAKLAASELIAYGQSVRQAVQSVRVSGCTAGDISFENNTEAGYEHTTPPARDECKIFSPSGGGAQYIVPEANWLDDTNAAQPLYGIVHFPEGNCVAGISRSAESGDETHFCDGDADNVDLLLAVLYLKQEVCKAINLQLTGSRTIPDDAEDSVAQFKYDGAINHDGLEIADAALTINGRTALCVKSPGGAYFPAVSSYHFYQVLLAR